ncbi:MAG: DNA polymerase II, partial [Myxococcales bacterium]|nr:DNA polymerase II [Myxococcales bacterium]
MVLARAPAPHEHDWLWGWDPTPGIVSVWAELDGRAFVWRRDPETGALVRDDVRFRPWLLLRSMADLEHLGDRLEPEGKSGQREAITFRELRGAGELRWLVRAPDGRRLTEAVLTGASRRLGRRVSHLRDLPVTEVLSIPPEEQYLVATGRNYFRDLSFDKLRRVQIDLETTGLEPSLDRIFLIALATPAGEVEILEAEATGSSDAALDAAEAALIERLSARIDAHD